MACLTNYTVQCRDVTSGKTGCFLFDADHWQQTGEFKAISPVMPDLTEFFAWDAANGNRRAPCYLERAPAARQTPDGFHDMQVEHGLETWLHKTLPAWIRFYPLAPGGAHFQAYRTTERVPAGRQPWTVNNSRLGSSNNGFPTIEAAAAAVAAHFQPATAGGAA